MLGAGALAAFSGKTAISFSVRLSDWVLGWVFAPPVILVAFWIWSRRRIRRPFADDSGTD
jgi:hypothetical protein